MAATPCCCSRLKDRFLHWYVEGPTYSQPRAIKANSFALVKRPLKKEPMSRRCAMQSCWRRGEESGGAAAEWLNYKRGVVTATGPTKRGVTGAAATPMRTDLK